MTHSEKGPPNLDVSDFPIEIIVQISPKNVLESFSCNFKEILPKHLSLLLRVNKVGHAPADAQEHSTWPLWVGL